jgi:hypothetical protein
MAEITYTDLASNVCEAIEILIADAITNADFDKTVPAVVTAVLDEEMGTYKVQYLGGDYIATAINLEDKYAVSDNVLLLVPEGDFTNAKKILGKKEEISPQASISASKEAANYDIIGSNVIGSAKQKYFDYCSYKPAMEVLYDANNKLNSKLVVNEEALKANMKKATYLQLGADIKTTIPQEQWGSGNFGLVVEIEYFLHEKSEEAVPVKFLFDTAAMTGTIFNIPVYISQYTRLRTGTGLYNRIKSITAFVTDFPNTKGENEEVLNDISFTDIALYTVVESNNAKWDSYYIETTFPQGDTLKEEMDSLTVEAKTTYKTRTVNNDKLEYYWFVENSSVDVNHSDYCSYGGVGWQCLNDFTLTDVMGQTNITTQKTWNPASNILTVKREQLLANATTYKCVANYPAKKGEIDIPETEFQLFNTQAQYSLDITSSTGLDYFVLGRGMTDLICTVKTNGEVTDASQFNFYWTQQNSAGVKSVIDVNTGGGVSVSTKYTNPELYTILTGFRDLLYTSFDNGNLKQSDTYYPNYFIPEVGEDGATEEDVAKIDTAIKEINFLLKYSYADTWTYQTFYNKLVQYINDTPISFISGNTFYDLRPAVIDGTNTFTCAVYLNNSAGADAAYIGTASFVMKNIQTIESGMYYAELENGNQVFKYSTTGHSPLSRDNATTQAIYPLSFTLYDKNGYVVPPSQFSAVRWKIPVSSTMLKPVQGNDREHLQKDSAQQYYIMSGEKLTFSIVDRYNPHFGNNDIILEVDIMGQTTKAVTNFTFLKDGVNGTNGTDYHCRISTVNNIEGYPTVYYNKKKEFLSTNFTGGFANNLLGRPEPVDSWFQAELWNSGKIIEPDSVSWKVLTNNNYSSNLDLLSVSSGNNSSTTVAISGSQFETLLNDDLQIDFQSKFPLLTIQAEVIYEGIKYYATQPVVLVYLGEALLDSGNSFLRYRMEMKPNTGFNEAMYSSDGTNPQMNEASPFEMCIKERFSANVELGTTNDGVPIMETVVLESDVTTKQGENSFIYNWSVYGSSADASGANKKLMTISNMQNNIELPPHKRIVSPPVKYDDYHINNGVRCDIYEDRGGENPVFLGTMLFPIHFYLNRYGLSFLNDWDGNSIDINKDEGRILSPQIGAGQKNDDNSFTGLFMGAVKSDDETTTKKLGLIGYSHSKQSIFLDAETGKAEFGISGEGQIILEPGKNAIIKSGNYQKASGDIKGAGMQIDLTTPSIEFGTKNFSVNEKGEMVAQGGGSIGGWTIGKNTLSSQGSNIILCSDASSDEDKAIAKITIASNNIPPAPEEEEPNSEEQDEENQDDEVSQQETYTPQNEDENVVKEEAIFEIYNKRQGSIGEQTYDITDYLKLQPNKLILSSDANNNFNHKKAEIYYVPGPKDSSQSKNFIGSADNHPSGYNCIRFSKPLGVGGMNSVLKGYIGIPLISQHKYSYVGSLKVNGSFISGSKDWKNQRVVKFGPAREYSDNIKHTILRGRNVHIYGFGPLETGNATLKNDGCITLRASNLYHTSDWQKTSDERIKDFYELDERYYNFFNKLTPMIYSYKGEDKKHCGYSAQEVKKALFESGLTLKDLDVVHIHNEQDLFEEQKYGLEDLHTLSYESLTPLYAAVLQKTIKELEEEKQKNIKLQNEIDNIKKYLQLD